MCAGYGLVVQGSFKIYPYNLTLYVLLYAVSTLWTLDLLCTPLIRQCHLLSLSSTLQQQSVAVRSGVVDTSFVSFGMRADYLI